MESWWVRVPIYSDEIHTISLVLWTMITLISMTSSSMCPNFYGYCEKYPKILTFDGTKYCLTIWSNSQAKSFFNNDISYSQSNYYWHHLSNLRCDLQMNNNTSCNLVQVKWLFILNSSCFTFTSFDTFNFELLLQSANFQHIEEPKTHESLKNYFWSKIIIFDFYMTRQSELEYTFKRFSRMRDYHNDPLKFGPVFVSNKIVADAVNATLLAKLSAKKMNMSLDQYPILNPAVQQYESSDNTVEVFWRTFRFSNLGETAQFSRVQSIGFNFAYCDMPSMKSEKPWNLSILINVLDAYIWKALMLSMFSISIVFYLFNHLYVLSGSGAKNIWPFVTIFFTVLSALISVTSSLGGLQTTDVCCLWTFVCIVVVNYYLGSITSLIIRPPSEDAMTDISQVSDKNYSLIFDDWAHLAIVNATMRSYSGDDTNGLDKQGTMKSVVRLLDRMKSYSTITNMTIFKRTIAYTPKTLMLFLWTSVLSTINDVNALIKEEQPIASKRKRCYMGKHVIPSPDAYLGFSPPGSERLRNVFNIVRDSGLSSFWFTEFLKMGCAKRVQDRAKVTSPTQINYDSVSTVSPLQMEGKIFTVFFLWAICVVGCLISYAIEVLYGSRNGVMVKRINITTSLESY